MSTRFSRKGQDPWVAAASPGSHQAHTTPEGMHRREALLARRIRAEWIASGALLALGGLFGLLGSLPLTFLAVVFGAALAVGAWSDSRARRRHAR